MLNITGLVKRYPLPPWWLRPLVKTAAHAEVEALRDVDLHVEPGELVGLVGPNGAGKTTLIKVVCGLLEATAGTVQVAGHDVARRPLEAKRELGLVLADERGAYWRLDGRRNLELFGILYGLPRRTARRRAEELLQEVGLDHRDRLVFGYSSGMRTRLAIARALLADPKLLLLDEPTRSLDPLASMQVNRTLRALADQGKAILLSSHRLDEVSQFCDRVVMLVDGGVRYEGPVTAGDGALQLSRLLEQEVDHR